MQSAEHTYNGSIIAKVALLETNIIEAQRLGKFSISLNESLNDEINEFLKSAGYKVTYTNSITTISWDK